MKLLLLAAAGALLALRLDRNPPAPVWQRVLARIRLPCRWALWIVREW